MPKAIIYVCHHTWLDCRSARCLLPAACCTCSPPALTLCLAAGISCHGQLQLCRKSVGLMADTLTVSCQPCSQSKPVPSKLRLLRAHMLPCMDLMQAIASSRWQARCCCCHSCLHCP